MIKWMSVVKKTNENQGIDTEMACINANICGSWLRLNRTLSATSFIPFATHSVIVINRPWPLTSSWETIQPTVLSWLTVCDPKWWPKMAATEWEDCYLVLERTSPLPIKGWQEDEKVVSVCSSAAAFLVGFCILWRLAHVISYILFEEILQAISITVMASSFDISINMEWVWA